MTDTMDLSSELALPTHAPTKDATFGSMGRSMRPIAVADALYDTIKVSAWAAALLSTPPFIRLAGVSLSDVPGEILFGHAFPTRLDHTIGVYHLARLARPRDRALQVAALAHDLGHGPFSHLTEPLMIERLGEDHETRSIRLLESVRAALPESVQRRLSWLGWNEVADLMRGEGRGALLNGRLDYDNADNVARFMLHAGFGQPGYDPRLLARGLRLISPSSIEVGQTFPSATSSARLPDSMPSANGNNANHSNNPATEALVSLQLTLEQEGRAWQTDRTQVYRFLHEGDHGHRNLAAHAMLRKAIDLADTIHSLPPDFFDLTDAEAFALLRNSSDRGLLAVMRRIESDATSWYRCIWEAEAPIFEPQLPAVLARSRHRLALEAQLAAEAGLAAHEVICDALVSNAARALPPLSSPNRPTALMPQSEPPTPPRVLHLFIDPGYGADYARRLALAAERRFAPLGIRPLQTMEQ